MTYLIGMTAMLLILVSMQALTSLETVEVKIGSDPIINRMRRVMNPVKEKLHSKPWMVYVRALGICGGFLVDPHLYLPPSKLPPKGSSDIFITAAHCITKNNTDYDKYTAINPTTIYGIVGTNIPDNFTIPATVFYSANAIIHSNFSRKFSSHDVAIVRLRKPVVFNEFIQPLNITTFADDDVTNCSLSGYGPDPKKPLNVDGNGHLTTAKLQDYMTKIDKELASAAMLEVRPFRIIRGDSGSPVVCYKDGRFFAQGVLSYKHYGYPKLRHASLFQTKSWVLSAMANIYKATLFHHKLNGYLRFGPENAGLIEVKLRNKIRKFLGFLPQELDVQLERLEDLDYYNVWAHNALEDKLIVEQGVFSYHGLIGYTMEQDVYHCAISCFVENSRGACNFVPATKKCYFLNIVSSCRPGQCIQLKHTEAVYLRYNIAKLGSTRVIKHKLLNLHTMDYEKPVNHKKSHDIYVSSEEQPGYICPAWSYEKSMHSDSITVSKQCFEDIIFPHTIVTLNIATAAVYINIHDKSGETQQIRVKKMFQRKYSNPDDTKFYLIHMELKGRSLFHIDSFDHIAVDGWDKHINHEVVAMHFNPHMGGNEVEAYRKKSIVLFRNSTAGEVICQGVLITRTKAWQSQIPYVLTSKLCSSKLSNNSYADFNVHIPSQGGYNEKLHWVLRKHLHNSLDIAVLVIDSKQDTLMYSNAWSVQKVWGNNDAVETFVYGFNLKCPHSKALFSIPITKLDKVHTYFIDAIPTEGYSTSCNLQTVNTGRPLEQCSKWRCDLLGLSTHVGQKGGKVVETFISIDSIRDWLLSII